MTGQQTRTWGPYDSALWHTCAVFSAVQKGDFERIPGVGVSFALRRLDLGERIFGSGEMTLSSFTAPGDGSYTHSGGVFMATGRGGLALTAGAAAVRAMGNSSRRRRAEAMAQPRWMPVDSGLMHVGTHGFYLQTVHGLHRWGWESLDSAQVIGVGKVWIQGTSHDGPISWIIESHWSELLFLLWALTLAPQHPQLLDGSWIPPHWIAWATEQGYAPPAMHAIQR